MLIIIHVAAADDDDDGNNDDERSHIIINYTVLLILCFIVKPSYFQFFLLQYSALLLFSDRSCIYNLPNRILLRQNGCAIFRKIGSYLLDRASPQVTAYFPIYKSGFSVPASSQIIHLYS